MVQCSKIEFPTARLAIDHVRKSGSGVAIRLTGILVISEEEARRLEAGGAEFAYLHERQGRIIAIPVNGDRLREDGRAEVDRLLADIADQVLGIQTLDRQGSDRLDFHDVAVWSLREALRLAYHAGREVPG